MNAFEKHPFYFYLKLNVCAGIKLMLLFTITSISINAQTINQINPLVEKAGSSVTITGSGLANKTLITEVYFGTIPATVTKQTTTSLTVTVPLGASYDRIRVRVPAIGTAISEQFFLVDQPSPCGFTNPAFDLISTIATLAITPTFVSLADVNADSKSDLLILSTNSKLTILLNTSSPNDLSFKAISSTPISLISKITPTSLAVSDLNSDGFLDIVVGYSSGIEISIIPGLSGTSFGSIVNLKAGKAPQFIAIDDLNKDGILEIVTGNNDSDKSFSILEKSTLAGFDYSIATVTSAKAITSIAIGDADADGNKDIITADGTNGFYYTVKDNYQKALTISSTSTNIITAGDYDQDGKTDVLYGTDGNLNIYNPGNSYTFPDATFSTAPSSIAGGDYNSDGKPDVAALFTDAKNINYISFFLNDGSGKLNSDKSILETGVTGKTNLAVGDMDQDGQSDIVFFNALKKEIYIYRKSTTVFLDPSSLTTTTPCSLAAASVSVKPNGVPSTISWYADVNLKNLISTGAPASIPASYLAASSNTIYARATSGGCPASALPLTITVKPLPQISVSGQSQSNFICQGATTTLTATGNATSYAWSPALDIKSPTNNITDVTPNAATITGSGVISGTEHYNVYTYTVIGSLNGCTNTASINVNVYDPIIQVSSSKTEMCAGQTAKLNVVISNADFLGSTFTWTSSPVDNNSTLKAGSQPTVSPTNTTLIPVTYTYSISGSTVAGCAFSNIGTTIKVNPIPIITPSSLQTIKVGQTYKQDFTVLNGTNPTYTILPIAPSTALPPLFTFTGNTLQSNGAITTAGTYYFSITAKEPLKCDAVTNYKLIIEDLIDPKLIVFPMYVHAGDANFFIRPSSTLSGGDISYTIKTGFTSSCATVGQLGYVSNISCADSIPVIVTQAAKDGYKQSVVETYIKISPNPDTKLKLTTTGVLLSNAATKLKYFTNSDAASTAIQIVQLNNTDIAQIKTDGTINTYKQGTVDIEIRVPATSTYEAITKTFTVTIYPAIQKPIIVNDTIIITVDQDTIVNILTNDYGVTNAIAPSQTDIDLENTGVQNKFYSLTIGNFLIDLNGNLNVKPFSGFIGEGRIGYTVTDSLGITSDVGYIFINVIPLTITPPLKANEVMTPNNDGLNDGLVIAYAYLDENNSLIIIDETGNVVYETTNYQNDWRGINKKGDAIEPGTYFYVYKEKNSGRELKNYIQIVK